MIKQSILLILLLLTPVLVVGHGDQSDTQNTPHQEQVSLSLPQIFAITVLIALVLLVGLYLLGITDKSFLIKMFVGTIIILSLDYIYVKAFS